MFFAALLPLLLFLLLLFMFMKMATITAARAMPMTSRPSYSLFCRGKNWQNVCGIVYCFSKKDCDEMAETLRKT